MNDWGINTIMNEWISKLMTQLSSDPVFYTVKSAQGYQE